MKFDVRPVPPEETYANNCARLGEHDDDNLDDLELEAGNSPKAASTRKVVPHQAKFQPFLPGAENWGLEKGKM